MTKGEPIAAVGSTGESTGPHLHYQLMYEGNPIDPQPFLCGVPRQGAGDTSRLAAAYKQRCL